MPKRLFLLVLVSSSILNSFSQTSTDFLAKEKKNAIAISPFDLMNIINPSLKIAYQRTLNPKFEFQIEYGYIINKAIVYPIINPREDKDDYTNKGYKLRMELKRYYFKGEMFQPYYSAELYYLENVSEVQSQFIISDPNFDYTFDVPDDGETYGYTDYFTNSKTKYGLNAKMGVKALLDPLFVEASVGIGIAYRNNVHSDRQNINDEPEDTTWFNVNLPREIYMLSLPVHFKIGYMF